MKRPSLSLAMIVKNEAHNLPRLFESIKDCFDEIHITDTGSTDATVEIAKAHGAKVHTFDWVDDFAAARNASFQPIITDYVMWLDGDDVLANRDRFLEWRDHAMVGADFWLATYHYAFSGETPVVSFARERVFKTSMNFRWRYFIHEGIVPESVRGEAIQNYVTTWSVNHMRTEQDLAADRSRNLKIFEKKLNKLDARMTYYYGKEQFEAGLIADSAATLKRAVVNDSLELHDRILALQYLCLSLIKLGEASPQYYAQALEFASQGIILSPHRAEFHVLMGDARIKMGQLFEAIPSYEAAKKCHNTSVLADGMASPLFAFGDVYNVYPRGQLIKVFTHLGRLDDAEKEADDALALAPDNEHFQTMKNEIVSMKAKLKLPDNPERTSDVVITCAPNVFYEWDGDVYREKGIGGSETACVELAEWIHAITGRSVIIFHNRKSEKTVKGVIYRPIEQMHDYMRAFMPALHVAWRHNMKVTNARTVLWCHDLLVPYAKNTENYEAVAVLSNFHKHYFSAMTGVPIEKTWLTRNGINPDRFQLKDFKKDPNKIIYSSSPDRGLDCAIRVMDHVVRKRKDAKLYVYYGFSNMEKMEHLNGKVTQMKAMIKERPYIKLVGNIRQDELTREFQDASVWLYPTYFLETFCITAIEALCCKVYPVVRGIGALPDTLGYAEKNKMATVLDIPAQTESELDRYAEEVISAIDLEKWQNVSVDPKKLSWESVAREWIDKWQLHQ